MQVIIPLVLLYIGYRVWLRVKIGLTIARTRRQAPLYTAHLASCSLCFAESPYEYQPCPEGSRIMFEEMEAGRVDN
jgi:hypothetical protein